MICPKDQGTMTRAGFGKRRGNPRCQKWQCTVCGHVVMENPDKATPEPGAQPVISVDLAKLDDIGALQK